MIKTTKNIRVRKKHLNCNYCKTLINRASKKINLSSLNKI